MKLTLLVKINKDKNKECANQNAITSKRMQNIALELKNIPHTI